MTIDLPEAPNPDASITKAEPNVAKPAVVEPTVPGTTTVAQDATDTIPELELIDQLWTTYREQLSASLEQQAAAVELADFQKKYNAAVERTETKKEATKKLLDTFLERLAAIRDPQTAAVIEQIRESVQVDTSTGLMDYEEYRKLPTKCVTSQKIEGLGAGKIAKLLDAFPTIGDLVDAQTEASKANIPFGKKLGKGIGEETGNRIAEVMSLILERKISIGEPAQVPKKVTPSTRAEELPGDDAEGDDFEDVEDGSEGILGKPSLAAEDFADDEDAESDDWENPHDDDSIIYEDADQDESAPASTSGESWAQQYLDKIRRDPLEVQRTWGAAEKKRSKEWQEGHDAQEAFPIEACPYDERKDEAKAKEWVRGYCAADALAMDL